jgi:hypothetical protein
LAEPGWLQPRTSALTLNVCPGWPAPQLTVTGIAFGLGGIVVVVAPGVVVAPACCDEPPAS